MYTFGEFLRQNRLARGLTMQRLAEELGVSPQFISLLEANKRRPSNRLLQRCAVFFGHDVEFLRFLAEPTPLAQKRAVFESPSAPNYIPRSLRARVSAEDAEDVLIQNLLAVPGIAPPEENTPYHVPSLATVPEPATGLQRGLIDQIRAEPERYSQKVRAWADFYDAYSRATLENRRPNIQALETLDRRLREEPRGTYPAKLRYLVVLHLALAFWDGGEVAKALDLLDEAFRLAVGVGDTDNGCVALWLRARIFAEMGRLLDAAATLRRALNAPDLPTFGLARCHSELADALVFLGEDEEALTHVASANRLWRTSTLAAPQEYKTRALFRVELAAIEANIELGRARDARVWLNRARAIRSRIEIPPFEEARLGYLSALLLVRSRRLNHARRRLREVLRHDLPDSDAARDLRAAAHDRVMRIALERGESATAQEMLQLLAADRERTTPFYELRRRCRIGFARCAVALAQGSPRVCSEALADVAAALRSAVEAEPRLARAPFFVRLTARHEDVRRLVDVHLR